MRVASFVIIGAVLLALPPAAVNAQTRLMHVNFGGGPTFLGGDSGNHFHTGWGPAIGVSVGTARLSFQYEYGYRWFDVDDSRLLDATVLSANHQTHQMDFNLRANLNQAGTAFRAYVVAGPGMYYRKVEITDYVGTGVICDPYWYLCGTYPVSSVVGSRGGWDFGFNVGGGVGFAIGDEAEFYIESRYHFVQGPEFEPPATASGEPLPSSGGTANGHYIPLTFGLRF